jgi:hypothetical protein
MKPWRKAFKIVEHPYEQEFSVLEVPDAFAKVFSCADRSRDAQLKALDEGAATYGNYYGIMFRFRDPAKSGGVLAALFGREDGSWKMVAWQVISQ